MAKKLKCPRCGSEPWIYPNVFNICTECGLDLDEAFRRQEEAERPEGPETSGPAPGGAGENARSMLSFAYVTGVASGIAIVVVWSLALHMLGDFGRVIATALASAVAAGVSSYYRKSSYERFVALVIMTLFAALIVNALVAKAYSIYFLGGQKLAYFTFVSEHYIIISTMDILLGALVGTFIGKPSRHPIS